MTVCFQWKYMEPTNFDILRPVFLHNPVHRCLWLRDGDVVLASVYEWHLAWLDTDAVWSEDDGVATGLSLTSAPPGPVYSIVQKYQSCETQ